MSEQGNADITGLPESDGAYSGQGVVYFRCPGSKYAIADLTEAIRRAPNSSARAAAYFFRGYTYREIGSFDRAISDFTQAISVEPTMIQAYVRRAIIYEVNGETTKSQADIAKAKELGWRDVPAAKLP